MKKIQKEIAAALCIALCVVLPYAFHAIPEGGSIFSPMHIPVLLCGLVCGWQYGLLCGLVGPVLSSLITQMPPLAYLPAMLVELAVYGAVSGLCMRFVHTKKYIADLYISLTVGMLSGRILAGLCKAFLFMPGAFTWKMWVAGYFITAWPGILLHLALVPAVVLALKKARLVPARYTEHPFERYFRAQYRLHPSMQAQDAVKLCYQAAYGAEHLLADLAGAEQYFENEFVATEAKEMPLCEEISPEVCRVNLAAWKAAGLPAKWLFRMFAASVHTGGGNAALLAEYLSVARRILPAKNWETYLAAYEGGAVHHSEAYRAAEKPAYRIVHRRFLALLPILQKIAEVRPRVIALEGRAASGKSTAAEHLSQILSAPVVHMDDFFLPPALRSDARLAEAGGNVDYERFGQEVLPFLQSGEAFVYRVFDCGKMELDGTRTVDAAEIRIVEGAYSMHPHFAKYADLTVFFDVDPDTQMRRIVARNGAQMAEMFHRRWIPMEETYYKTFRIRENANLTVKM